MDEQLKLIIDRLDRIENMLDNYTRKLNEHLIQNSYEKGLRKGMLIPLIISSGIVGGGIGSLLPNIVKAYLIKLLGG